MTGRRGPARRLGERGFSLPELLVSITVLSIVLAAVGTVFTGSLRTVRELRDRTTMAADARIGLEAVTRSLRVAIRPAGETSAITLATGSTLTFYASLNRSGTSTEPLPTKVEYAWNGSCLTEAATPARTLTNPPATGPFYAWDTGRTSKCLVRTTVAPTFSYFSTPEISTGGVDNAALTIPSGGLDDAGRSAVQSVQVSLTALSAGAGVSGATVLDRVTLNNVILDTGE